MLTQIYNEVLLSLVSNASLPTKDFSCAHHGLSTMNQSSAHARSTLGAGVAEQGSVGGAPPVPGGAPPIPPRPPGGLGSYGTPFSSAMSPYSG